MNTQSNNIGELIHQLKDKRDIAAAHAAAEKAIRAEITELEATIRDIMIECGIEVTVSHDLRVAPKEEVYPQVEDWDAFYEYIKDNGYFHLLERRPTVLGFRELFNLGRQVPGVVPNVKAILKVTKASK